MAKNTYKKQLIISWVRAFIVVIISISIVIYIYKYQEKRYEEMLENSSSPSTSESSA